LVGERPARYTPSTHIDINLRAHAKKATQAIDDAGIELRVRELLRVSVNNSCS
jgi:hypothetical protein